MVHIINVDHLQRVTIDGVPSGTSMTRFEEATLRAILGHSHCATKEFILSTLYGGRDEPELKIVDVFVCKLRAKLGEHRGAIATVWGRGYARGDGYQLRTESPQTVSIDVDAGALEDVVYAAGGRPQDVVNRLLADERKRLWSAA